MRHPLLTSSSSATTRTRQCCARWQGSAESAEIQVTFRWVRNTLRTHSLHKRHTLGTHTQRTVNGRSLLFLPQLGTDLPPLPTTQNLNSRRLLRDPESLGRRDVWHRFGGRAGGGDNLRGKLAPLGRVPGSTTAGSAGVWERHQGPGVPESGSALGPDGIRPPASPASPSQVPRSASRLLCPHPATRSNALAGRKVKTRSTTSARLLRTKVLRGSAEEEPQQSPPPPTRSMPHQPHQETVRRLGGSGSDRALGSLSRRALHFRPIRETRRRNRCGEVHVTAG